MEMSSEVSEPFFVGEESLQWEQAETTNTLPAVTSRWHNNDSREEISTFVLSFQIVFQNSKQILKNKYETNRTTFPHP